MSAISDMRSLWTIGDPRVRFYTRTSSVDDLTRPLMDNQGDAMRSVDDVEKNTSDSRIVALGLPLSPKHSVHYNQDRNTYKPHTDDPQRVFRRAKSTFQHSSKTTTSRTPNRTRLLRGTVQFALNSDRFTRTLARATLGTTSGEGLKSIIRLFARPEIRGGYLTLGSSSLMDLLVLSRRFMAMYKCIVLQEGGISDYEFIADVYQ
ncbi:hypothetical protein BU15DRAFT_66025 [Melanogaster broomeanus]|nr:hypothetical protein BU15DRAFT_66025 [Melanogaster broomeanus]